jgi:hypothetical protein
MQHWTLAFPLRDAPAVPDGHARRCEDARTGRSCFSGCQPPHYLDIMSAAWLWLPDVLRPTGLWPCVAVTCWLGGCASGHHATPDAGAAIEVADPQMYAAPAGEPLAFGVRDGDLRNYFIRQGPVAAHLIARSGQRPRLLAAFPASNQGIGVWFTAVPEGAALSLGETPGAEPSAEGGELTPVVRRAEGRDPSEMRGVRATLASSASELSTELVLLGNVRTLRDYGYGVCLEDATQFPTLRNESIELDATGTMLRIRRQQLGGHWMELALAGKAGTTLALRPRQGPARSSCRLGSAGGQPVIVIRAGVGSDIQLELHALADDQPLTPIAPRDLFVTPPESGTELSALAFLSYEEKLLAGSWRFLTYFGRDTLLSIWLLLPALQSQVAEAALGSVLERVELTRGMPRPEGGTVDVGDVAHEEEVGDFVAYENSQLVPPPADLRQPRYDYKMIDDDFLLAPLLVALMERLDTAAPAGNPPSPSLASFLSRTRSDGRSFEQAALANLGLVLRRARPFADARPPDRARALVSLHDNLSVGQWRDSEMGLAFGRYPFDVNAGLVPGALSAAATLYERLGKAAEATEARRLLTAWQTALELFRIELPLATARANVAGYAAAVGLVDSSSTIEPEAASATPPGEATAGEAVRPEETTSNTQQVVEYGIALDQNLRALPVMHSDHGFVLAYAEPPEAYLRHVAALLSRPFPAGLMSPLGVVVANPALADASFQVTDPRDRADPADDASTPLRDLFTTAHYHGTVVWSWQQALLARGLRRQLTRSDLGEPTRAALENAECQLWGVIDATREQSTRELWSWAPGATGQPELRPFGAGQADADESNAIQLWSTVYLAVHKPTPALNRCGATGVSL